MSLEKLLEEKLLLVVVNKTTCETSSPKQIEFATLGDWKLDIKKAIQVDYIIGIRHGTGVSCYKVDGLELSKINGRVRFKSCEDISNTVKDINLKDMGIRKGYKEIQYINI